MKKMARFSLIFLIANTAIAAQPPTYLALGDSVPFGMNSVLVPPYSTNLPTPSEFVGFPITLAQIMPPFKQSILLDASCPGETSGSFLNTSVPDNGCNSNHIVFPPPGSGLPLITLPPFKPTVGLHVQYSSPTEPQMAYALSQLGQGSHIKLVTLMIGGNDVLLALPQLEACGTDTTCSQNVLGPVLQKYGQNLAQILAGLRSVYSGTLIVVTYYAPTPQLDPVAQALNGAITSVAAQFPNITIADAYKSFKIASTPFQGDACVTGLLIKLPPNPYNVTPCDVHPSPLGRDLLAATVDFALLTSRH